MVVLDGASDRRDSGKTPLEMARTPNLDSLARRGVMGQLYTVGKDIAPESDAGVFSLLGYDPLTTPLSRGVVEALGARVDFHDGDLALRAGFATVEGDRLVDRRAGRDLTSDETIRLGAALNTELHLKSNAPYEFKPTVGHRAVVVFRSGDRKFSSKISNFDPAYVKHGNVSIAQAGKGSYEIPRCEALDGSEATVSSAALVNEFGFKARGILDRNPVNLARRNRGQLPANFILMRDAGTNKPEVQTLTEKWGLKASMIADLPAELGIGKVLGMENKQLKPGTSLDDYHERAQLVLELSRNYGFVYVHLKGPDEPGHDGLPEEKIRRIEEIDTGFFGPLTAKGLGGILLCVTCDHSTPWRDKGHSSDPVPVLVQGGSVKPDGFARFTEADAAKGSLGTLEQGSKLMPRLVGIAHGQQ
jgi:2,3-bisphosphoglycerate-independent phosphoglycerate mutase